jgi:hypothetical protein
MVPVYHNAEFSFCLILPVTRENIIGTYMSGGEIPAVFGKVAPRWLQE